MEPIFAFTNLKGSIILIVVLLLVLLAESVSANHTHHDVIVCTDGLIFPVWMPQENISGFERFYRGLVYFFALFYLFIGVSIVSDRFMAAIEVITSKEKEVKMIKSNGESQIVVVRVWNETVANLTLMALGSSAPEILLSVIEMFAKHFEAGDLGPGTIVGSAAYNLFVIIALCICVIPDGEVRRIKHLRVFLLTATWSVFAYIWLYVILAVISPGRVDVWEGLLTFAFFPLTVLTAYIADRRLLLYKYLDKNYRMNKRGVVVSAEGDAVLEMNNRDNIKTLEENGSVITEEVKDFEEARREYITTLKQLRKKYPQSDLEQLEMMAQEQLINKGPKSRAFYRIQATRKMMGSGNIMKKIQERAQSDLSEVKAELQKVDASSSPEDDINTSRIYFEPGHYTVMESCGSFEVRVVRRGELSHFIKVDFETEDGTAEAGSDYVGRKGTLNFPPGVDEQRFKIEVIDDEVFEQDEHFYVRLSNCTPPAILATPKVATVMILDDDHAGIFSLCVKDHDLVESVGMYPMKVQRYSGARGKVLVPYWTEDGTAKAGKDYEMVQGELLFENNEIESQGTQMLYGTTLRLSGEFFDDSSASTSLDESDFVKQLRKNMAKVRLKFTAHHDKKITLVQRELRNCTHVFVGVDKVKHPLKQPYKGPTKVQKLLIFEWQTVKQEYRSIELKPLLCH